MFVLVSIYMDIQRIQARTTLDGSGCWLWLGATDSGGYANLGGKKVHRLSLAAHLGRPIRTGFSACHTCDVRHCVNPAHLYEGTYLDNAADRRARPRDPAKAPVVLRRALDRPPRKPASAVATPDGSGKRRSRLLRSLVASRVTAARKHAGLSRQDLADLLGLSERAVEHWEKGLRVPELRNLCRIAAYCDVTLVFLLFDVDEARERIAREK